MAKCIGGLKIIARYSNTDGPCPGGHQCDIAKYNFYLGTTFLGIIDLDNGYDGGDRQTILYANAEEINDYISEFGCELNFEAKCYYDSCHENIIWFTIEDGEGKTLFNSCELTSFTVDCCDEDSSSPPPPPLNTTVTSTTVTTSTTRPVTNTTRIPGTTTTTRIPAVFTTRRIPNRCDPSTKPPPIIEDPSDIILTTIPSTNSPWGITLINSVVPLSANVVLTTVTTTVTTTTTTTTSPSVTFTTNNLICDDNCNKLNY